MSGLSVGCLVVVVVATLVGVALFGRGIARIVGTVKVGRPTPGRRGPVGRRLGTLAKEVVGHGRFRHRPVVRVAHWVVMVSFPLLFVTLVAGYGQVVSPRFVLPWLGRLWPLEWAIEAFSWAALVGIVAMFAIRLRHGSAERRSRFFGSNMGQAFFVEATVAVVVAAVLVLRGLEYAFAAQAGDGAASTLHFPLTAWYGSAWASADPHTLDTAAVIVATVKIVVSMTWFVVIGLQPTMGVAWHRFLAIVNIYARREPDGTPALGPLQPITVGGSPLDVEALESLPDDARLGAGAIEDLSWKQLLDVATCTECGRCQDVCPAWATGKPLSPKKVVLQLRDHAAATAPYLQAGDEAHAGLDLIGDVIDPDALWACTSCGACVQQCPVDIEHVDTIVDLRRYQVLMESAFPKELGGTFTKLERQGNPWGLPARARMDWAKGLDVPVVGVDVESAADVDYLFWVGCAGAYDDRAKRTSRAVVELLHAAGVSFAVLGDGEGCTGDPARRAGNEILFQMLAAANVEALNESGATRIVVTCAHCFNTIAREYPQLGGRYEVLHHTELLNRLVAEGRLVPAPAGTVPDGTVPPVDASADADGAAVSAEKADAAGAAGPAADATAMAARSTSAADDDAAAPPAVAASTPPEQRRVTYHDPCYLGRHNQVYAPPRELLAALPGVELAEMPRNAESSFCCGAGGARVWMEETIGTRISTSRAAEALGTGAEVVATACPYCTIMLTDGVKAASAEQAAGTPAAVGVPEVTDIALLLLDSIQR